MKKEINQASRETGQAAVESAIVLPLMFFLVLAVIQMAMLQHARLMTEYAAFNAVRAGIVWNGNQCMMRRAAVISLLPTIGPTDTFTGTTEPFGKHRDGLLQTWLKAEGLVMATAGVAEILESLGISSLAMRMVDVQILNPTPEDISFFRGERELEFDAIGGDPEGLDFETKGGDMRKSTVLTTRVTFLYPMKIPFANWTIFYSYLAHRVGLSARGGFFRPGVAIGEDLTIVQGASLDTRTSGSGIAAIGGDITGLDEEVLFEAVQMVLLWNLGQESGIYLFPMHATHSMRMQSNFFASSFESADLCLDI